MLTFRKALETDADLYFQWANDAVARENSYNKEPIKYEDHIKWFKDRVNTASCYMYLFLDTHPVGQVRIEISPGAEEAIISISVEVGSRGKGYSSEMIRMATNDFLNANKDVDVLAYIFRDNVQSHKAFLKAGYKNHLEKNINGIPSYILKKQFIDDVS